MKPGMRASKGLYLLLLRAENEIVLHLASRTLRIGAGTYVYVGSACGPGGLAARLSRHLCGRRRRLHWHIDKLIEAGLEPILAIAIVSDKLCAYRVEPFLALVLSSSRGFVPIGTGIGSTDDKMATTHLYKCIHGNYMNRLLGVALSIPGVVRIVKPELICDHEYVLAG